MGAAYCRGMNILNVPVIIALGGALIVMGCDRDRPPRPEADKVAATGSPATPRPPAPVADPSLPPAASVLSEQGASAPAAPTAPTARDSAATQPMKDMSKQEESSTMPKANQANNHSSPALDPATTKSKP